MRNYFRSFPLNLSLIVIIGMLLLSSCAQNSGLPFITNASLKNYVKQLSGLVIQNPNAALHSIDSIAPTLAPDESAVLLAIYLEQQKAYAALKNMDSVVSIGEKIRALATETNDSLAMALSLMPIKGDIDYKAQQKMYPYFPGAISTFHKKNMLFEKAKLSASYGAILFQKGDFVSAQQFLFKAYDFFKAHDSTRPLINICINIGNTYSNINSMDKAKEFYSKALSIAQQMNDSMSLVSVWMNRGTLFGANQQDSALFNNYKALSYLPFQAPYYLKMKLDYNLSKAYMFLKVYDKGEQILQQMLQQCIANGMLEGEAMSRKGLGELYALTNRTSAAVIQFHRALAITDSLGMGYRSVGIRTQMIPLFLKLRDYKTGFELLNQNTLMKDSIVSEEKQIAVHELEAKYETAQKEHEIVRLNDRLSSRRKIITVLIIASLGLFILYRQRNRLYRERTHSYDTLMKLYREDKASTKSPKMQREKDTYAGSSIPLSQQIQNYYQTAQPYKNSKLKVLDLSKYFDVSEKEITAAIKLLGDANFSSFTNRYRVEDARLMFEDRAYDHLKLEAIAELSGFGTRQNFYNAFESSFGVNPGYYRKQMQQSFDGNIEN